MLRKMFLPGVLFFLSCAALIAQWQATGPYNGQVWSLEKLDNKLYSATWTGVMCSVNNGDTWQQSSLYGESATVYSLLSAENKVFAGMQESGIRISTDGGVSWLVSHPNQTVVSFAVGNGRIFAGCKTFSQQGEVLVSTNGGFNWASLGLTGNSVLSLIVSGINVVAGTQNNGIYISSDNGLNWNNVLNGYGKIQAFINKDSYIFAGTSQSGVLLSTNNGLNWTQSGLAGDNVLSLKTNGGNIFAGTANNGLHISTNNGLTFLKRDFPYAIYSLFADSGFILAGTVWNGMYKTTNNGNNWQKLMFNNVKSVCLISNNASLFTGAFNNGLCISSDGGNSWSQTGLVYENINSVAANGNNIFAGAEANCSGIGLYRSTNAGFNWSETGFYYDVLVTSTVFSGNKLLVGSRTCIDIGGIHLSTDNGNSFVNTLPDIDVITLFSAGNTVYAGTPVNFTNSNGGVYFSSNGGYNWQYIGPSGKTVESIAISGNALFVGTGTGVYLSTNNGVSWVQFLASSRVHALLTESGYLFAGTESGGVYFSSNNGVNWIQKNQGLISSQHIRDLAFLNNKIYASTYGNSVIIRDFNEIVSVGNNLIELPLVFSLMQNYPNPFNSETKIIFTLKKECHVKITIYDIAGKELQTFLDKKLYAGVHNVIFNGNGLNSGLYFYKLTADGYSETRRMVIIK